MAGFAIPLIKPLLDAALAGAAANGTMGMNKTKEGIKVLGDDKKVLGDGKKTSSEKKVEKKEEPEYKTLSRAEKDELMITLAEGGLSTREIVKIMKSGYISDDQLKRIPVELRRKIAKMTGQELEAQLGLGSPDDNGDDNGDDKDKKNDDKDKKNKEKREKLRELKKKAEKEQLEWKKKEAEFQKNNPKSKRRAEARKMWDKAFNETLPQINKKDPKFLGNTPEQKMKMGEERMKQAIENGTGPQWEYQHVTPTSNPPVYH